MTKPKPKPKRPVDAVKQALDRETGKRGDNLKPIEIVKVAIGAFQAYVHTAEPTAPKPGASENGADKPDAGSSHGKRIESSDRTGFRRGTQAAMDRMLFNANYWLTAYESRIVEASPTDEDAKSLLKSIAVWNTHTLKLNTLPPDEVIATFERFCPPFAVNNRRGAGKDGTGKGPVPDFIRKARSVASAHPSCADALEAIVADIRAEADAYENMNASGSLDALFALLPAWCLQDRIGLVSGTWWNDQDTMSFIATKLHTCFLHNGYGEASCQYFLDSCLEAIDAYQRDVTTEPTRFDSLSVSELIDLVHNAREAHPDYEADGYGGSLPTWLISKEQLIWNIVVCALYGPASARPLLVESPDFLANPNGPSQTDIITDLARTSFARYAADRAESNADQQFPTFADQPPDLRNSSIEHIRSIPGKLEVLGYGIMPLGSCYPSQRITELSPSEVECLAILEHRRWLRERDDAGWSYSPVKNVDAKTSPYLVPWEDLPDRAREWNRSAVRNIPALLASENLAITR